MSLVQYFEQMMALARANLKVRYRNSAGGFVWVILNPLILFGVQSFVFGKILKVNIPQLHLYLIWGLLPWIFVSQSIQMTATMVVNSSSLLKSFNIQPFVLTTAQVIDNFINMILVFILLGIFFYFDGGLKLAFIYILPAFIILFIAVAGLSFLVSILNVFYRDTSYIASFALNISFYLTPIFYDIQMVDVKYRWLYDYNFLYKLILPFQQFTSGNFENYFMSLVQGFIITFVIISFCVVVWRCKRNGVYNAI